MRDAVVRDHVLTFHVRTTGFDRADGPAQTVPPAIRRVLPLSLTFDHPIATGGEATRFLNALEHPLEEPS